MMPRSVARFRLVRALAALLALASLAGLSGCGSDSRVVARVGSQVITAGEFRDLADAASQRMFMPPDTARHRLLDQLIERDLLLAMAESRPPIPAAELAEKPA